MTRESGTGFEMRETPKALDGFAPFAEATLAEWRVPGAAIAVVKDGAVIYARGFGLRDVARGLEATPRTTFAIASATKAFTTLALAILVDEGLLDWDRPVRAYLPSFALYDPVATERLTPRDLVTHRSGLPAHDLMPFNSPYSRREIVARLRCLPPSRDMRSAWQYQNLTYIAAGYLIEHLTGLTWERFVAERIFGPLSMEHSTLSVEDLIGASDRALPYGMGPAGVAEVPASDLTAIGPAGAINSTVEDMARWLLLHLGDGRHGDRRIVSAGRLADLHAPQMVMEYGDKLSTLYDEAPYSSYGMGWFVQPYRGHDMLHHGGNIDGFSAMAALLPRKSIGVVVLSNLSDNPAPLLLTLDVVDRLLGLELAPWAVRARDAASDAARAAERAGDLRKEDQVGGTAASHDLDAYAGDYEHPGYGVMSILRDGAALTATYNGEVFALPHYHYDVFELVGGPFASPPRVVFSTDHTGAVESLSVPFEPTVPDIVFVRRASAEARSRAVLDRFTGEYTLLGLAVAVTLGAEETLTITLPGQPAYALTPRTGTRFHAPGFSSLDVTFTTDDSGAVTGALISQQTGVFMAVRR